MGGLTQRQRLASSLLAEISAKLDTGDDDLHEDYDVSSYEENDSVSQQSLHDNLDSLDDVYEESCEPDRYEGEPKEDYDDQEDEDRQLGEDRTDSWSHDGYLEHRVDSMPHENAPEHATSTHINGVSSVAKSAQVGISYLVKQYESILRENNRLNAEIEANQSCKTASQQQAANDGVAGVDHAAKLQSPCSDRSITASSRDQPSPDKRDFVAVLIDCDGPGYTFHARYLRKGASGGEQAAKLLRSFVKAKIRHPGLWHCRATARVYADFCGESRALARVKILSPEQRSLGVFAAGFSSAIPGFDFVDAGGKTKNARLKVLKMLREYADNPYCRHIFFGGCHDTAYIVQLAIIMERGGRDRVTLLDTWNMRTEFQGLGLSIEACNGLFSTWYPGPTSNAEPRTAGHEVDEIATSTISNSAAVEPLPTSATTSAYAGDDLNLQRDIPTATAAAKSCHDFAQGHCKLGDSCQFLHVRIKLPASNQGLPAQPPGKLLHDIPPPPAPVVAPHTPTVVTPKTTNTGLEKTLLPLSIPAGRIALNCNHHRLDARTPAVMSPRALQSYHKHNRGKTLCPEHHINLSCNNSACPKAHGAVATEVEQIVKMITQATMPCSKGGLCRRIACVYGHVCQKSACLRSKEPVPCKFGDAVHDEPRQAVMIVSEEVKKTFTSQLAKDWDIDVPPSEERSGNTAKSVSRPATTMPTSSDGAAAKVTVEPTAAWQKRFDGLFEKSGSQRSSPGPTQSTEIDVEIGPW